MGIIESKVDHLIFNADGASKDIKFQANGVEKASISSTGAFTSTTIDATKLTGSLPAIDGSSLTNLPAGGKVLQVVHTRDTTQTSVASSSTYTDIGLSASITPSATTSSVLVFYTITAKHGVNEGYRVRLLRDSTVVHTDSANVTQFGGSNYIYLKTPHQFHDTTISTASAVTYKIQVITYLGNSVDFQDNGADSEITLMEIGA